MKLCPLTVALAGALLALPAFAGTPTVPAPGAARAVTQLPVDHQYRSVLHGADGKPVTRAAFDAALRAGQRYVSKADPATHVITMTLLPPGIATPDSFAPTDLKTLTFLMIMNHGHHYSVEFHDVNGHRIDRKTFTAGAPNGQRYTQVLDSKTGAAVLTLLPAGASPAGSLPTARWINAQPLHVAG